MGWIALAQAAGAGYAICRAVDTTFARSYARAGIYALAALFLIILAGSHGT